METLLAVGIGIGLASVAGVRAFLPLALAALYYPLTLLNAPNLLLPLLNNWTVIGVLFALAVLECALDKFAALDRPLNWTMVPVRAAAGAVLFATAMVVYSPMIPDTWTLSEALPELVPWIIVGSVIGGAVAMAKVLLRPSAKATSAGVSAAFLSVFEDVVALAGGVVGFFVPFLPVLLVAFLLFFFYRIRKRRGRKYGGLRILGD
jgi:Domain of unknown function (DUF4126)